MLKREQRQEIEDSRIDSATLRPTVAELEAIMFEPIPVLDHGFIRVIDYMGNDAAIVQAARVSYGRGTKQSNEDKALINYLMRHSHTTPFEMAEIKLHIKLPIFVARQWIRHRTANVNEYSARYSILEKEFYLPAPENLAAQSSSNRQGRERILNERDAATVLRILKSDAEHAYDHYLQMLGEAEQEDGDGEPLGLARELARMNLPLNFYTQWYWKIDLHNLMSFLKLRADPHAQYEIRVYAEAMLGILKRWAPWTYDAFLEHRLNAIHLSASAFRVVREMIAGRHVDQATSDLSNREWTELLTLLQSNAPPLPERP